MSDDGLYKPPWTEKQVKSLNDFQDARIYHPFTCSGGQGGNGCHQNLVATTDGWRCPKCGYEQNWADGFMANDGWREMFDYRNRLRKTTPEEPSRDVYD